MIPPHALGLLRRVREHLSARHEGESATLKEMRALVDLEGPMRTKLQQLLRMAQSRKEFDTDKEADELDRLLKQANLTKPRALSDKQYEAIAEVWEALSDGDVVSVARTAMRAINLL